MKYVLWLLLLVPTTVSAEETKFHYNECVTVVKGFYKGCTGRVTEYFYEDTYQVELKCPLAKDVKYDIVKGYELKTSACRR